MTGCRIGYNRRGYPKERFLRNDDLSVSNSPSDLPALAGNSYESEMAKSRGMRQGIVDIFVKRHPEGGNNDNQNVSGAGVHSN